MVYLAVTKLPISIEWFRLFQYLRMKRLLLSLCICAYGLATQAQITQLPDNFSSGTLWIVRVGANYNGVTGSGIDDQKDAWEKSKLDGSFKRNLGASISFGFNKSFGNSPLYWGMELGAGMRGYKTEATKNGSSSVKSAGNWQMTSATTNNTTLTAFNAQLTPIMIGYKLGINDKFAIDFHVGGYASYDFAGNFKSEYSSQINTTSEHGGSNQSKEENTSTKIGDIDHYNNHDFGVVAGAGVWFGHFNLDFIWQRGFISFYDKGSDLFSNNLQLRLGYAF